MASPILRSWGAHPKDRLCQAVGSGLGGCPRRGSRKMSSSTAHLLTTLFMAAAVAYPSRRSATDLDATPRTTVTFDGKGVWVLVVSVRFRILLAHGLVQRGCIQPSPTSRSRGTQHGGGYRGVSGPLGSRNWSPHGSVALDAQA